jgi:branched-chain amino acid transport system substrate-binding protein
MPIPPRVLALLASALAASLALLASGCGGGRTDDAYRIGVITSQTGASSQLGLGELQGAQLAADLVNARGGIHGRRLELVVADDLSTPVQAVLAARRMIDNVDAVVGPSVASTCNAITPLAQSSRTVQYCLSPGIKTAPGGQVFSASVSTTDLIRRTLASWQAKGITRIGLLNSTDASGQEGAASLRTAVAGRPGTQLVAAATFEPGAVSVTSQLQAVTSANPQALVVWSTGAAAAVALKAISQLGVDLPVATTNGNLTYAFLRRIADYTPATLLIPATRNFWSDGTDRSPPAAELEATFHRDFQARFGGQPDFGPGVAYDAVLLLADALGRHPGDRTTLNETLERTTGFVGVVGTYRFRPDDHRGLGLDDVAMVRVAGGGFIAEQGR